MMSYRQTHWRTQQSASPVPSLDTDALNRRKTITAIPSYNNQHAFNERPSARDYTLPGVRTASVRALNTLARKPKRQDSGLPSGGAIEWLRAEYDDSGNVTLGGRLVVIHPTWRALFLKWTPGHVERVARIVEPLGRALKDLLLIRPIGVVQGEDSRLLVVSHVDYFCLAVQRQLEWIPVYYFPHDIDCVSLIRIDGLLDPLLRAQRSDADRLIRTLGEAEQKGMPLVARGGHPNGTYRITVEDLAYLMQRDQSTVHTKLRNRGQKRTHKPSNDQVDTSNPMAKDSHQLLGERDPEVTEETGASATTASGSFGAVTPPVEQAAATDAPVVDSAGPPSLIDAPAPAITETAEPVSSPPTSLADSADSSSVNAMPVVEPAPKRSAAPKQPKKKGTIDERQQRLF